MSTPLTDEREAFEKWADANQFCIHRDDSDKYVNYHRATTRFAWEAWQARAILSTQSTNTAGPEPVAEIREDRYGQTMAALLDHELPVGTMLYATPIAQPPAPEALRQALGVLANINDLACFASEEDTSTQRAVLLQIGERARAALSETGKHQSE